MKTGQGSMALAWKGPTGGQVCPTAALLSLLLPCVRGYAAQTHHHPLSPVPKRERTPGAPIRVTKVEEPGGGVGGGGGDSGTVDVKGQKAKWASQEKDGCSIIKL